VAASTQAISVSAVKTGAPLVLSTAVRVRELDGIRGLAVGLVLLFHFFYVPEVAAGPTVRGFAASGE
jgi:uncharacterized membrane protein